MRPARQPAHNPFTLSDLPITDVTAQKRQPNNYLYPNKSNKTLNSTSSVGFSWHIPGPVVMAMGMPISLRIGSQCKMSFIAPINDRI